MLVYNPKNVVSPDRSSEKICHVMNAKGTDFVLENYDRMSKNLPEDYPFDINGKSINLKKLVIKAFQRSRPTAVAVNAFAVGTHMEAYPEASSTCGENPTPLLEKLRRCRSRSCSSAISSAQLPSRHGNKLIVKRKSIGRC